MHYLSILVTFPRKQFFQKNFILLENEDLPSKFGNTVIGYHNKPILEIEKRFADSSITGGSHVLICLVTSVVEH